MTQENELEKKTDPTLSRRDFLKLLGPGFGALGALPFPELGLEPPTSSTPDQWRLSLEQRLEFMSNPGFFTELQGGNTEKIITLQSEYEGVFRNNNCGQATLATIAKMCAYLNTGIVPETFDIAHVNKILLANRFTDIKGVRRKYFNEKYRMYWPGLAQAAELVIPQFIAKTEHLTPNRKIGDESCLSSDNWPKVMLKTQNLCERGGFAIIGCMRNQGHILLATDVEEDSTGIVVDSLSGKAQRVHLGEYLMGIVTIVGVTPKLAPPYQNPGWL